MARHSECIECGRVVSARCPAHPWLPVLDDTDAHPDGAYPADEYDSASARARGVHR